MGSTDLVHLCMVKAFWKPYSPYQKFLFIVSKNRFSSPKNMFKVIFLCVFMREKYSVHVCGKHMVAVSQSVPQVYSLFVIYNLVSPAAL